MKGTNWARAHRRNLALLIRTAAPGRSCNAHAQHRPATLFGEPLEEVKTHRQPPQLSTKPSQPKREDAKNLNQN